MDTLKHWGWTLLMAACCLLFYVWVESANLFNFSAMENFELVAETVAILCALLGITVLLIVRALDQRK